MSQATTDRVSQIVEAARDLLETQGPDGLTMRAVAARLNIRAPSLYKHVESKDDMEVLLIAEAFRGQGAAMHAAVDGLGRRPARRASLTALGRAYRAWAIAHPHLYRLATEGPLPREALPEGLEAWTAEPLVRVTGSEARARATWAFAHGMTILELDGRFPPDADLDQAWAAGIAALS
ncbi:MAG TPA: TetR/AcrR family transcriptional regulator [Actinomycetota bacterium]